MDFDDISLSNYEKLRKEWVSQCSKSAKGICALASRYRNDDRCLLRSMHCGSFNFSLRLHWDDNGEDWLIRFPIPGKSMFLDEKVHREAVLMGFIAKNTKIPVPKVIAYGTSHDNPTGLGPFIIMTWIEGRKMSEILRKDGTPDKEDLLDPNIDQNVLKTLYSQMADILLELWRLDFQYIGSLGTDEAGNSLIEQGPLTLEMNELIRTCGLNELTPSMPCQSSVDYITSLLQLQSKHLEEQRNSVYDAVDCREKYACRHLMKAITGHFVSLANDTHGPFKLFSDDLGPGNVLVDDSFQVTGVIDWEFCYTAPAQFAGSIPWWLLLEKPEKLINDMGASAFLDLYLPKANLFVETLEEKEGNMFPQANRLSTQMRESIRTKSAWFYLACRMVSSVDLIYWDMLDESCWGPRVSVAERVRNFTTNVDIHSGREEFVRFKVSQLKEYYAELGEDIDIGYEEDQPHTPSKEGSPNQERIKISPINKPSSIASAVVLVAITIAVGTLRKYYRS